jgi:hypothetical protein
MNNRILDKAIEIIFIYLQIVFLVALLTMKLAPCDMYADTCQNFSDSSKEENFVDFDDYLLHKGRYFKWAHLFAGASLFLLVIPIFG